MKILKATDLTYVVKQYSDQPQIWKLYDLVAMYHEKDWDMMDLEEALTECEYSENGIEIGEVNGTFLYHLDKDIFTGDLHGAA